MTDITQISPDQIKGYECRFATFCDANQQGDDLHVVKEYIHLKNGERIPHVRLVKNYQRDFWVTKQGAQDHQDKKERERLDRLTKYTSTQSRLADAVSRALHGRPAGRASLRQLAASPYLYGCDISSTALLKKQYETKYPDCISPQASVAVLDIETDVVSGHGNIILVTLSFKDRVITAVNSQFLSRNRDPVKNITSLFNKHLGEVAKRRNIHLEIVVCDTPGECCATVMKRAHEWRPDFITVWNIDFDLPKIAKALEKEGYDLGDVFSDPSVPPDFRFYKYRQGRKQKVTQDGSVMSIHPADRWHVVTCPASFSFVCAMSLAKKLRAAKGNEPSYSLDHFLTKFLGKTRGKLSLPEADHLERLKWHKYMQSHQPFFYAVYNIYDCVGVEELDEVTGDIAFAYPVNCGNSDFSNFTSNPRRIMDDLHYDCLADGYVVGTTSQNMSDDNDEHVVGVDDWVICLSADNMDNNGLCIIEGMETTRSMLRIHNADSDVAGTYPHEQMVFNMSKETTLRELSRIRGLTEWQRRSIGINLSGGPVNALEICHTAFGFPTLTQWIEMVDREDAGGVN